MVEEKTGGVFGAKNIKDALIYKGPQKSAWRRPALTPIRPLPRGLNNNYSTMGFFSYSAKLQDTNPLNDSLCCCMPPRSLSQ